MGMGMGLPVIINRFISAVSVKGPIKCGAAAYLSMQQAFPGDGRQ